MSRALALALAVLAAALVALALAPDARAATADVTIAGSVFSPGDLEVRVGDVVRWTNEDGIAHTARAAGHWDSGTISGNGGSWSRTMSTAGTFSYACAFHPGMTGTLRVLEAAANMPPIVSISSPAAGSTLAGVADVLVAASDPDGDALNVTLRIDGGEPILLSRSGGGWLYRWETRDATQGTHTLTARAHDGELSAQSSTLTVSVNNPPGITLSAPSDGASYTIGKTIVVAGSATSPVGQNVSVEVSVDGGPWQAASGRAFWSWSWNTSGAAPGQHTVQARVSDALNVVLSPTRSITLREPLPDHPPVLALLSPSANATLAGLVNVTGTASDPDGTTPLVEVSSDGVTWLPATGRKGNAWWFHWLPDEGAGNRTLLVRASADDATVALARPVVLAPAPAVLTLQTTAAREGAPVVVRVMGPNATPVPAARVLLRDADGSELARVQANATGYATLPLLAKGAYTARGYAPNATGFLAFDVGPVYDIAVSATEVDFEQQTPIVVSVHADRPARSVPVQLIGEPLPGGRSDVVRTDRTGNASISLQALTAGELAVHVAGNDTGLRVRIAPTVLVDWTPDAPAPRDLVRARFTLNDAERTPLAFTQVTVDVPGQGRQVLRTDEKGELTLRPNATGTLRATVPREAHPSVVHALPVLPAAPKPELSGLVTRPGPASIAVALMVKNAGSSPTVFALDALATSGQVSTQETAFTRELAPGDEERVTMTLAVGLGQYEVLVTARNSTASIRTSAVVLDEGVPPAITPLRDAPAVPAAIQDADEKESPGAAFGALAALALVALARRRPRA